MKLKHIAIIGSLFPILFSLVLFFGVLISADSDDENSNFSSGITVMNLSAEIREYISKNNGFCKVYPAPFAVFLNKDDKTYVEPDIIVICNKSKLDDHRCNSASD